MDFHDFWEKEKKWVLGLIAGAMVFWIGLGLVRSAVDVDGKVRSINSFKRRVTGGEAGAFYDRAALDAAEALGETLEARNAELREAVAFTPDPVYQLDGKGAADTYFAQVGRSLSRRVVDRAENLNVLLEPQNVKWPSAVEPSEIAETLLGLNLLDVVADRLLSAGETVRVAEPENLGLVAIEQINVRGEGGRPDRYRRGQRGRSNRGGGDEAASVRSVEVEVRFSADAPTVWLFLEACRAETPRITLGDFQMKPGSGAGDPQQVRARFAALVFEEA